MSKPSSTKTIQFSKEDIEDLIFQHLSHKGYAVQGKIQFELEDIHPEWNDVDPSQKFSHIEVTVLDNVP